MPAATQALLDDSVVNLDQWIAEEVQTVFAEQESLAFVTGNGTNKPRGFTDYPKVADASWSWGNLGYIATGVAGAFAASNPVRQADRPDLCGEGGLPRQCQLGDEPQDASGDPQVQGRRRATTSGSRPPPPTARRRLMNFPITEAEHMPDIATDTYALAFGDFKQGYLIVDRVGVRILRDPYSSKPYVLFYTTKRVGGGVQNFEAIKLMKFGVS